MKKGNIKKIIKTLRKEVKQFPNPLGTEIAKTKDSYKLLISTILSARAKDTTTYPIVNKLFKEVKKPKDLASMPIHKIEKKIKKIGFYKNKAKNIKETSKIINKKYKGKVPKTFEELIKLPGVGRKTANLVIGLAFNIPSICVDTHVHKISNRLGLVKTKTPEKTETELMKKLPKKYWIIWNKLLVQWGQNICTPTNPKCNKCKIKPYCKRIKVKTKYE